MVKLLRNIHAQTHSNTQAHAEKKDQKRPLYFSFESFLLTRAQNTQTHTQQRGLCQLPAGLPAEIPCKNWRFCDIPNVTFVHGTICEGQLACVNNKTPYCLLTTTHNHIISYIWMYDISIQIDISLQFHFN